MHLREVSTCKNFYKSKEIRHSTPFNHLRIFQLPEVKKIARLPRNDGRFFAFTTVIARK